MSKDRFAAEGDSHHEDEASAHDEPIDNTEAVAVAEWMFMESTGDCPCERQWPCIAVVEHNIYLFGGFSKPNNASKFHGDFYRFDTDLRAWSDLSDGAGLPSARHSSTMVYHGNRLFLFGGCGEGNLPLSDLWYYDIPTNTWTKVKEEKETPPAADPKAAPKKAAAPAPAPARTLSRAATSVGGLGPKGAAAAPGKVTVAAVAPLVKDSWPCPRFSHTSVVFNDSMYVYAGSMPDWTKGKYVWKFDMNKLKWEELETNKSCLVSPDRRFGHVAAIYQNKMYIYGGLRGVKPTHEVWVYDLTDHKWTQVESATNAGPRKWHTGVVIENMWVIHGGVFTEAATPETEIPEDAYSFNFNTHIWTPLPLLAPTDEGQPIDSHAGCVVSSGFSHSFFLLFGRRRQGIEAPPLPEIFCFDFFKNSGHLGIQDDEANLEIASRMIEEQTTELFRASIDQLSDRLAPMKYSYDVDILPALTKYLAKVSVKIANVKGEPEAPAEGEKEEGGVHCIETSRTLLKQIVDGLSEVDRLFRRPSPTDGAENEADTGRNTSSAQTFITALAAALGCKGEELTKFIEGESLSGSALANLKPIIRTLESFETFRAKTTGEQLMPAIEQSLCIDELPLNKLARAFEHEASKSAGQYFHAQESLRDSTLQPKQRRPFEIKKLEAAKLLLVELEEKVREIIIGFQLFPLDEKISWECLARSYEEKMAAIEHDLAASRKTAAKQDKVLSFLDKVERERVRARADTLAEFEDKRVAFVDKRSSIIEEIKEFVSSKLANYAEVLNEERQLLLEAELYRREAEETTRRIAEMKDSADKPRKQVVSEQTAMAEVIMPVMQLLVEEKKEIFGDVEKVILGQCALIAEDTANDVARFERLVDEVHGTLEKQLALQENSIKMIQNRIQSKKDYMVMMTEASEMSTGVDSIDDEGTPEEVEAQIEQLELSLTNLHTEMDSVRQSMHDLNELNEKFNSDISLLKEVNDVQVFPAGCKMNLLVSSGFDWENAFNCALASINESFDPWIASLAHSMDNQMSPMKEPADENVRGSSKQPPRPAGKAAAAKAPAHPPPAGKTAAPAAKAPATGAAPAKRLSRADEAHGTRSRTASQKPAAR